MRKRNPKVHGPWRPAHAVARSMSFESDLRFERLEERRLLAGVPELLDDINPGGSSNPAEFVNAGGTVFFRGNNATNGPELWKTDGSMAGTLMVKDIRPMATGSSPSYLTAVGGTLFFAADDGTNGVELWKSDGTTIGTTLVKNINPAGNSSPSRLTNVEGTLFFQADDGTNGVELWTSDGTEVGTTMVMDINSTGDSDPRDLTNVSGKLFFSADNGINGPELWMSDPVAESTLMVKDINPGVAGSSPGYLGSMANVGGVLFFSAYDATNGFELWKSNGTMVGTTLVKNINPGDDSSFPLVMAEVDGTLFFSANDGSNGFELWKSDGTLGGTTLVKDINTAANASSIPDGLANVGGTLYFRADDGTNGVELWKSDGTFSGTELVLDINASASSTPRYLTNVGGTLYFRASQGTTSGLTGTELWQSDGTPGGTTLVLDIAPDEDSSDPGQLANINGTLLFSAESAAGNREPWILSATSASVAATHLFYNHSFFDGNEEAAGAADDAAMATDKVAYLPGSGPATFDSVSSYSKGINGVMLDLAGEHGELSAGDFILQVGSSNTPASWPLAPAPLPLTVRTGAGVGGSDRVELIWANNAIEKTWLQVTVKANFNTNLATPYTFLYGNAVGESGIGNSPTAVFINSTDQINARNSQGLASVTNPVDFNRDAFVNSTDEIISRNNQGFLLLPDIASPAPTPVESPSSSSPSDLDGNAAANGSDESVIVIDESANLPSAIDATFGHMASVSLDINGIVIDLSWLHLGISVADFKFQTGDKESPGTWTTATAPTMVFIRALATSRFAVRPGLPDADHLAIESSIRGAAEDIGPHGRSRRAAVEQVADALDNELLDELIAGLGLT